MGSRVYGYVIPMNTLTFDPKALACTTADQLKCMVDLLVEFSITDPVQAATQSDNLFSSIEATVMAALYETSRASKYADLTSSVIERAVSAAVNTSSQDYGFKLQRVYVECVAGPASIAKVTEEVETQRRQKVAELDKLQQESEIKLSQQRLKMMLTEASAVETQLIATNDAKRKAVAARAEIEVQQLQLTYELESKQKRQTAETEAYRVHKAIETEAYRQQQIAESEAYRRRLAIIGEATMSDEVKIALLRGDALQALSKDPSTKMVLTTQDSLQGSHLHLQGPILPVDSN